MKAWDIGLDYDGDHQGWVMKVRTEDCESGPCEFSFVIPLDVAQVLHRLVRMEIDPSILEMEAARASYGSRTTVEDVQGGLDAGVYDHDPGKRIWAERVVSGEIGLP